MEYWIGVKYSVIYFQIHTSLVNGRPGVDGPSEELQVRQGINNKTTH